VKFTSDPFWTLKLSEVLRATQRSSPLQKNQITVEIDIQQPRHPPRQAIPLCKSFPSLGKDAKRVGLAIRLSTRAQLSFPRPHPHLRPASFTLLPWRSCESTSIIDLSFKHRTRKWSSTGRESTSIVVQAPHSLSSLDVAVCPAGHEEGAPDERIGLHGHRRNERLYLVPPAC